MLFLDRIPKKWIALYYSSRPPDVAEMIAVGKEFSHAYNNALDVNATLSTELTEARDNYQLGKLERQLDRTDLLILDELSYLSFNKYESDLLFKVLSDRSERSSTIVTTNLPFSKWTELFENTTMVAALVDRLTYRSHILDMNGPSYRLLATQGGSDVH